MLEVWTDGALDQHLNGGWAWATEDGREESGSARNTSSQRMELYAALRAVEVLGDKGPLCVVTDSAYVSNCFLDNWHMTWRRNNWKTSRGKPVQNKDLWEPLISSVLGKGVTFRKVRGHSGDPMNEHVDKLAVAARLKLKEQH